MKNQDEDNEQANAEKQDPNTPEIVIDEVPMIVESMADNGLIHEIPEQPFGNNIVVNVGNATSQPGGERRKTSPEAQISSASSRVKTVPVPGLDMELGISNLMTSAHNFWSSPPDSSLISSPPQPKRKARSDEKFRSNFSVAKMHTMEMKDCGANEWNLFPSSSLRAPHLSGYCYTLDAPTSGMIRPGDDPLTYLNKDQFYGLTLKFVGPTKKTEVYSLISLQFRDRKTEEEAKELWDFWLSRQHSSKSRLIDVDAKVLSGVEGEPFEIAHNALMVKWNPSLAPAFIMITIRCLSTDFSAQKGVKGIPLHIQVDTYDNDPCHGQIQDRGFCQIKTFCDKGAERKAREEEKKMSKHPDHQIYLANVQSRSVFQRISDVVTEPVLYLPEAESSIESNIPPKTSEPGMIPGTESTGTVTSTSPNPKADNAPLPTVSPNAAVSNVPVDQKDKTPEASSISMRKGCLYPNRVLIYAKQNEEECYTPLHVTPPTVQGLIRAVSTKYQIESVDIRCVYRLTLKGHLVKIDDDMIKYYSDGSVFDMKVLAFEESEDDIFYDLVFGETELTEDNISEVTEPKDVNLSDHGNKNNNNDEETNNNAVPDM